jgi:hypothetical protein
MLFTEIIAVYFEKPINTLCRHNAELLIFKSGGTDSNHWPLKVKTIRKPDEK